MHLNFGHVVAHGFQLHGHTHPVHDLQAGDIGLEGVDCTRLYIQGIEVALHSLGTITHQFLHLLGIGTMQVKHLVKDVLVEIVISAFVSQVQVEVLDFVILSQSTSQNLATAMAMNIIHPSEATG